MRNDLLTFGSVKQTGCSLTGFSECFLWQSREAHYFKYLRYSIEVVCYLAHSFCHGVPLICLRTFSVLAANYFAPH